MLASQGVLTYCTNRTLPYHLYADGSGLLVLAAPLPSGSLSKTTFLTGCRVCCDATDPFVCALQTQESAILLTPGDIFAAEADVYIF